MNSTEPRLSVVIPVYQRPAELRRVLASLAAQCFADFECMVIDDCSPQSLEPVVSAMADARFRYLRNSRNGGPYNARTVGYRHMRGEYLLQLDSDWEVFPWTLERAVHLLDAFPEVNAVAGMHMRVHDGALLAQVRNGRQIVGPREYVGARLAPDCVGAVRHAVVREWLRKRDDYFAMEFHQWFTFGLHHSQLYVEEPWSRYHVDGADRVSTSGTDRRVEDYAKFLDEHESILQQTSAPFLTDILSEMWLHLLRAGRTSERGRVAQHLRERGVRVEHLLAARALRKLARHLGLRRRVNAPFIIEGRDVGAR